MDDSHKIKATPLSWYFHSDLTNDFLHQASTKDIMRYQKRDNCGCACLEMQSWAMETYGIALERIRGELLADQVVYEEKDFTIEMKQAFQSNKDLDFYNPEHRRFFIMEDEFLKEEWKKIPHYWLVDKKGMIHDPSGKLQIIDRGLSKDLNKDRYVPSVKRNFKMKIR